MDHLMQCPNLISMTSNSRDFHNQFITTLTKKDMLLMFKYKNRYKYEQWTLKILTYMNI